ncbi:MAG: hypothetical protein AAGD96_21810 [Chloroflexota bacterium]
MTSSTSVVQFDSVEVFPLEPTENNSESSSAATDQAAATETETETETNLALNIDQTQEAEPASAEPFEIAESFGQFSSLINISGNWSIENAEILQSDADASDHLLGLNTFGQQYSFDTTLTMGEASELNEIGGGIVFNTPQPDSRNNGQVVRFFNGGSDIVWGFFDENGGYSGQGGLQIGLERGVKQKIGIDVNGSTFDILVNDEIVASAIDLNQPDGGYVNLVTFMGPVTFHEINFVEQNVDSAQEGE